jgi:hypothetical protein
MVLSTKNSITLSRINEDDFANIAFVENDQNDGEPWDEEKLVHRFSNTMVKGFKAEVEGRLAGYVIYEQDDTHHQNSIIKLLVTPEFRHDPEAVWNALLQQVKQDMSYEGRNHIVVYTSAAEEELVQFLKKPEMGYKIMRAAGADHVMAIYELPKREQGQTVANTNLEPNLLSTSIDTSMFFSVPPLEGFDLSQSPAVDLPEVMNSDPTNLYGSYTISSNPQIPQYSDGYPNEAGEYQIASEEPETAPAKFRKMAPRELMAGAREKLTALTGMEWETVLLSKSGKMQPLKINNDTNPSEVYLRTASKVKNPARALAAISEFQGEKPPRFTSNLSKSAQVVIPASWFRQVHLSLGKPGKLSDDFIPAATQLRYECHDERAERQDKKAAQR